MESKCTPHKVWLRKDQPERILSFLNWEEIIAQSNPGFNRLVLINCPSVQSWGNTVQTAKFRFYGRKLYLATACETERVWRKREDEYKDSWDSGPDENLSRSNWFFMNTIFTPLVSGRVWAWVGRSLSFRVSGDIQLYGQVSLPQLCTHSCTVGTCTNLWTSRKKSLRLGIFLFLVLSPLNPASIPCLLPSASNSNTNLHEIKMWFYFVLKIFSNSIMIQKQFTIFWMTNTSKLG